MAAGSGTGSAATTSRFSAACGALSQYVKAAERARARPAVRPLPLMPGAEVDASPGYKEEPEPEPEAGPAPAQLTIVYGGRVLVLDDVPAEKVASLVRLAAAARPGAEPTHPSGGARILAADLPVARKASLQLFMEKRKGRLAARGEPYRRPDSGACPDYLKLAL